MKLKEDSLYLNLFFTQFFSVKKTQASSVLVNHSHCASKLCSMC